MAKILSMPLSAPTPQTYTGTVPTTSAGGGTNTANVGVANGTRASGTITMSCNHSESSGVTLVLKANGNVIQTLKDNGSVSNGETINVTAVCAKDDVITLTLTNTSGAGGGLTVGCSYSITM